MNMMIKKGILFLLLVILFGALFTACDNPFFGRRPPEEIEDPVEPGRPGGGRGGRGQIGDTLIRQRYFLVKFEAEGGSPAPGMQKIAEGATVARVAAMTNGSEGFAGWYTDKTAGVLWDFSTPVTLGLTVPDPDDVNNRVLILWARWVTSPTVTVTFDAMEGIPPYGSTDEEYGGSPGNPLGRQTILQGAKAVEPSPLRKSAGSNQWYGFGGWYTEEVGGVLWDFNDPVDISMTLYARWEGPPPHCTVIFNANGGLPAPRMQDLSLDSLVVEPLAMARENFGFGGWFVDAGFSIPWDFSETIGTRTSLILYAKWVVNEHVVTFNSMGGSPTPSSQVVAHGSRASRPTGHMTLLGKGFVDWFTAEGDKWNFDDAVVGDMTLYANWIDGVYTVDFRVENGSPQFIPPQSVAEEGRVIEPSPPSRADYIFAGWYWDDGSTRLEWHFDIDTVHTDLTLIAQWVPPVEGMVWVRGGSFIMGDDKVSGAGPAHRVRVTGFYMAVTPVTQGEYARIMLNQSHPATDAELAIGANNPSHFSADPQVAPDRSLLPVEQVSWFDAIEFLNKMTDRYNAENSTSLTQFYNVSARAPSTGHPITSLTFVDDMFDPDTWKVDGFRLPTEAEWEFAAKGGYNSTVNYAYSGSDDASRVSWYNTNTGGRTRQVNTLSPNTLGIYHMSGNISEWCWDWFDSSYYTASKNAGIVQDPRGPGSSLTITERVRRGGSWSNSMANTRLVLRSSFPPGRSTASTYYVVGIRAARSPGVALSE